MPTFCRHNRFIERCPICSRTLPGNEPAERTRSARAAGRAGATGAGSASGRAGGARTSRGGSRRSGEGLRVRREGRAIEDGYGSELVPGLRASSDAARLAEEIEFAQARLTALAVEPVGLYAEAAAEAVAGELEAASWACLLIAYLGPAEEGDPFDAIRSVLAAVPGPNALPANLGELLDGAERGPRSSHEPGRGARTLSAYAQWLARNGGTQVAAFEGDGSWTPQRRFSRLYERLALPGFTRAGRYELLVSLGRLGVYELRAESLQLTTVRGQGGEDATTTAAKRVFGIGDPLLLERRAAGLAEAAGVPIEVLDLALANWQGPERATMGFRPERLVAGAGGESAAESSPREASSGSAETRAADALGV